jgi:hypothetical protein
MKIEKLTRVSKTFHQGVIEEHTFLTRNSHLLFIDDIKSVHSMFAA